MKINKLKGTLDFFGDQMLSYRYIEKIAMKNAKAFGYKEVVLPTIEATELFARGVGEGSDIVTKEMYTFNDRSDRSITLRPEGTAGVARWFVENKIYANPGVYKYCYMGSMFRYERPQAGRYREFKQFGVEAYGKSSPLMDADIIAMADTFLKELGIKDVKVLINNIGSKESRAIYEKALKEYLSKHLDSMCEDCKRRYDKNPLRILDCKVDAKSDVLQNAPKICDYLVDSDSEYANKVIEALDALGIKYEVNDKLVRGLDYYTSTVFEFVYDKTDAPSPINGLTLLAGGRYNGLTKELDGPEIDSIGFACGVDRLILVMNELGVMPTFDESALATVITLGDNNKLEGVKLANCLRSLGYYVDIDYLSNNLKPQFKLSEWTKAKYVLIIGDDEITNNTIKVKDVLNKTENEINIKDLIKYITNIEGVEYAYKK